MTLCVHYIQDVSVDYRQHDVTSACNNQTMLLPYKSWSMHFNFVASISCQRVCQWTCYLPPQLYTSSSSFLVAHKTQVNAWNFQNYYPFMSRSTCIPLYPATDGRQTGDNFVADTRNMLTTTSGYSLCPATWLCPGVNAALDHYLHSTVRTSRPLHDVISLDVIMQSTYMWINGREIFTTFWCNVSSGLRMPKVIQVRYRKSPRDTCATVELKL